MRLTLHKFLTRLNNPDVYLLHCDLWKWDNTKYNCINCGIQEPNMVNIAAGLASQGKKVIVYGVVGYVVFKTYEQMRFNIRQWADEKGCVIFVNAGHNGAYKHQGRGGEIGEDQDIMNLLGIPLYDPPDRSTFVRYIVDGLRKDFGSRFIRLGWDGEVWKKSP